MDLIGAAGCSDCPGCRCCCIGSCWEASAGAGCDAAVAGSTLPSRPPSTAWGSGTASFRAAPLPANGILSVGLEACSAAAAAAAAAASAVKGSGCARFLLLPTPPSAAGPAACIHRPSQSVTPAHGMPSSHLRLGGSWAAGGVSKAWPDPALDSCPPCLWANCLPALQVLHSIACSCCCC